MLRSMSVWISSTVRFLTGIFSDKIMHDNAAKNPKTSEKIIVKAYAKICLNLAYSYQYEP